MTEHGTPSHRARHSRGARRGTRSRARSTFRGSRSALGLVALAFVAVAGAGVAGGALLAGGSTPEVAAPASAPPPDPVVADAMADVALGAKPTMIGRVDTVVSGDELTATVAGSRPMPIRVLGLAADAVGAPGRPGACGGQAALDHASSMMAGQTVTLVPDPTQSEFDDRGRRLAYVVLRTQLSYTDAALDAGVSRADTSRPLWYAPVFAKEQAAAAAAGRGIWGAPCRVAPPG